MARLVNIRDVDEQGRNRPAWVEESAVTGIFHQVTALLNNAQVKTLPTVPVEIVSAQGANKVIVPLCAYLQLDTSAGGYTTHADASISIANDNNDSVSLVTAVGQTQLQGTTKAAWMVGLMSYVGVGTFGDSAISNSTNPVSNYINKNLAVTDAFAGHGQNYTGGNAANTLLVSVIYLILDVTTGRFE